MNSIFLKYGNFVDGEISWSSAVEFKPSKIEDIYSTTRISGRDLRDIPYNHLVAKRSNSIAITLTPIDLMLSAKMTFLIAFYGAMAWQYNLTNTDWETEAVRVVLEENGNMPYEIIQKHKQLKKVTLNLIQKEPD
ncbi:MAG: hypothetical protein M9949_06260 [Candidatus Kapabacteria bacterium]|nr:hypothetical protein [Candidatus Kapabacteria bacterium]